MYLASETSRSYQGVAGVHNLTTTDHYLFTVCSNPQLDLKEARGKVEMGDHLHCLSGVCARGRPLDCHCLSTSFVSGAAHPTCHAV